MTAGGFPLQFGKFLLTSLLARGGMSHVFLAKADGVYGYRRLVVIKRMLGALSEDPRTVSMFLEEARLGTLLQHRNIAQVFEFGEVDGQLFLALEYVDGLDAGVLSSRLRHDGVRLPLPLCLYVGRELCRGLDYAHRHARDEGSPVCIIHRDVSPSNVLVSREGAVKLCDFGIAVAAGASALGTARGKFSYLSPEQAAGGAADWRTDLFSLGIVLWELLSGQRLYRGETDLETLEIARTARVPPLGLEGVSGAERLQSIVDKTLAPAPAKRWQTAWELRQALDEYCKAHDLDATGDDLASFLERTCPGELRRRGQRRDGAAVDAEQTPVTPSPGEVACVPATDVTMTRGTTHRPTPVSLERPAVPAATRAGPHRPTPMAIEAVVVPEEFPEVVSSPVVEQELIVSRPATTSERPEISGQPSRTPLPSPQSPRRPATPDDRLIEHLTREHLLTRAVLDRALAAADRDHTTLPRALLAERLLPESELCHAISEIHGIPVVDLSSWSLSPGLSRLVPLGLAQARDLCPFRQEKVHGKSTLCIAMADPDGKLALPEVELHSGMRCKPFLARPSAIAAAIDRVYRGVDRAIPPLSPRGTRER